MLSSGPSVLFRSMLFLLIFRIVPMTVALLLPNWGSETIGHPKSWLVSGGAFNRPPWLFSLDSWPLHLGSRDSVEASWGEIWMEEGDDSLKQRWPWAVDNGTKCILGSIRILRGSCFSPFLWNLEGKPASSPKRHCWEWEQRRNNIPAPLKRRFQQATVWEACGCPVCSMGQREGAVQPLAEA